MSDKLVASSLHSILVHVSTVLLLLDGTMLCLDVAVFLHCPTGVLTLGWTMSLRILHHDTFCRHHVHCCDHRAHC